MCYPDDSFRNMALGVKISEGVEMVDRKQLLAGLFRIGTPAKVFLAALTLDSKYIFITSELVGSFVQRLCKGFEAGCHVKLLPVARRFCTKNHY